MSTNKASNALLSRIANAALKEFKRNDLYVAQVPAGIGLSDAHLNLLQQLELERLKDPASVARLVELSRIVDCIQSRSTALATPVQEPGYLSNVFQKLINNVEFDSAPLSNDEQRQYERALSLLYKEYPLLKTTAYQEFCILRSDVEKKDVVLLEMRQNLQKIDNPEERTVSEHKLLTVEKLHNEQQELLESLDRSHGFRAAEAIIDNAARKVDQIPESVRLMLDTIELQYIKDPITNDMHVGCSFFPSHLAEDNWVPLRLTSDDIAQGSSAGLGTPDSDDPLDENEIDLIELEVQTVICERPWFWSKLFIHPSWGWRTPSDPVSTGDKNSDEKELIPSYIFGLIFGRNLTLKGRPSAQSNFQQAQLTGTSVSNLLMRAITPQDRKIFDRFIPSLKHQEPSPHHNLSYKRADLDTAIERRALPISRNVVRPGFAIDSNLSVNDEIREFALMRDFNRDLLGYKKELLIGPILQDYPTGGRVIDEKGNNIYGAKVTLHHPSGQRQAITDEAGRFTFTLGQGRYSISVEKDGFATTTGSLTSPQTYKPQLIRMQPVNNCQLLVRLVENGKDTSKPFLGQVKVMIKGLNHKHTEVLNGQSERQFSLPPGNFTVTVVSSEASEISPSSQQVNLQSSSTTWPTLTYTIIPAPILSNLDVQLLGFICCKVPRCP